MVWFTNWGFNMGFLANLFKELLCGAEHYPAFSQRLARCQQNFKRCFCGACDKLQKAGLYLAASPSGSAATCGAALHCLPSAHNGQSGTSGRAGVAEVGSGHNLPAVSPHTCCRRKRI